MLSAIIVAAGNSTRVGFDKLFATIAGQPVIQYSIAAFEQSRCVEEIVVVCREAMMETISKLIGTASIKKVSTVIRGGERRQDSVAAGLRAISATTDFVAIHDAARPLITPEEIERVFSVACKEGAAVLAAPVTDTLKQVDANETICGSIEREHVFAMQTPQIFSRALLVEAYDRVASQSRRITDEVSAVQMIGTRIAVVPARDQNMKITFASDLPVAELILRQRSSS